MTELGFRWFLEWLGLAGPRVGAVIPRVALPAAPPAQPPSAPPSAPPWSEFLPAPSVDGGVIRATILRDLLSQIDELSASDGPEVEGDIRFLRGLVRCLGSESLELPVFPDVSLRLDRLLRRPNPPMAEVVELISRDPDLLRRVWTSAHSAMFARGVAGLDHAIARIGFDALWRIGMAACVHAPVFRAGRYQGRVERLRARGMVAGKVAAWIAEDPRGDAFLAGMLHGAGGLYVWRNAAASGRTHPSRARVQRVLRRHACGFGVLMARAWGFGDEVAVGVGYWPQPEQAPSEHRAFAQMVHVAVVATMAVEEAKAGHDCGGLEALSQYEGATPRAGATLAQAERIWRGESSDGPEATSEVVHSA